MFRKIVAYLLVALQLFISPLSYAFPVLTYLGADVGMYFSSTASEGLISSSSTEDIYFHVYKGIKPRDSYIKWLEMTVKKVNPDFKVRMVTSNIGRQGGHYRVLVGPADRVDVAEVEKSLKALGVDNFPSNYSAPFI
ncbi:SPOR domain-containing protein [Endozoicomonas sp.]|uniref:SPOR domain-containing protein n=1 Tax=Endozoicomonas sp. TaxID=1892382 RepID=UPI003AF47FF0